MHYLSALQRAAIGLSIALILAPSARAQASAPAVTETTDPSKAAAVEKAVQVLKAERAASGPAGTAAAVGLVRGQSPQGWGYLSGGITVDDRAAMYAERERYTLWVATVARGSGAYLADARLRIAERKAGGAVFERTLEGPWFLIALPPGAYDVQATLRGDGQSQDETLKIQVSVPARGQRQAVLRFKSTAQVGESDKPFKGNPFGKPASAP